MEVYCVNLDFVALARNLQMPHACARMLQALLCELERNPDATKQLITSYHVVTSILNALRTHATRRTIVERGLCILASACAMQTPLQEELRDSRGLELLAEMHRRYVAEPKILNCVQRTIGAACLECPVNQIMAVALGCLDSAIRLLETPGLSLELARSSLNMLAAIFYHNAIVSELCFRKRGYAALLAVARRLGPQDVAIATHSLVALTDRDCFTSVYREILRERTHVDTLVSLLHAHRAVRDMQNFGLAHYLALRAQADVDSALEGCGVLEHVVLWVLPRFFRDEELAVRALTVIASLPRFGVDWHAFDDEKILRCAFLVASAHPNNRRVEDALLLIALQRTMAPRGATIHLGDEVRIEYPVSRHPPSS